MRRQLLFLTLALIIGASMSLFDIDRHNDDRGSPAPNHTDSLTEGSVKAHKTISSHYTTDADTNAGRLQMLNKQVLANDGTTNKALFGYQQGLGLWGAFVAKPGVDVNTNTDLSQFIFNSSQNVFKIVAASTVTIAADTFPTRGATFGLHQTTTTVAHGLSFVPQIVASVFDGSTYQPLPSNSIVVNNGGLGGYIRWDVEVTIDATNLNFTITSLGYNTTASTYGPVTIKYYLLQETAN